MFTHPGELNKEDLIKAALGYVYREIVEFTWRRDNEQRKIFINIAKRMLVITPYLLSEYQWSFSNLFFFFYCSVNDIEAAENEGKIIVSEFSHTCDILRKVKINSFVLFYA